MADKFCAFVRDTILEGGFRLQLRNQEYEYRELPENMVQQELDQERMIVD